MKSFLKFILVCFLLLIVGVYFGANYLLEKSAHSIAEVLVASAPKKDLKIEKLDIVGARVRGLNKIGFDTIIMKAIVNERKSITRKVNVTAHIENLSFRLTDFSKKPLVTIGVAMDTANFKTFVNGKGNYSIDVHDFDSKIDLNSEKLRDKKTLKAELKKIFEVYLNFVDEGRIENLLEFKANSSFAFKGQQVEAKFGTKREDGYSILTVRREDIAQIASLFDEGMGEDEIDLITAYPTRAARLLHIKNNAQKMSGQAKNKKPGNPTDAYRHVMWSYMITKEYGADFAKKITDAHETGSTTNSEGDHLMDYNNNYIGREYASKGYTQDSILRRILRDKRVVWSAKQAMLRNRRARRSKRRR